MPLHGKIVVIKRSGGDGTEFPLTAPCLFGRKVECDIRIQLPQVSKEHCRIDINENKQVILTNLSLVNPTCINGKVMQQSERLKHGDLITIIDRSFRFEYPPEPTPKKRRASIQGKSETLQVIQEHQVREAGFISTEKGKTSLTTEHSFLKDETNISNLPDTFDYSRGNGSKSSLNTGLAKNTSVEKESTSPFSELYQMVKQNLDTKLTWKPPAVVHPQTPLSRCETEKASDEDKEQCDPMEKQLSAKSSLVTTAALKSSRKSEKVSTLKTPEKSSRVIKSAPVTPARKSCDETFAKEDGVYQTPKKALLTSQSPVNSPVVLPVSKTNASQSRKELCLATSQRYSAVELASENAPAKEASKVLEMPRTPSSRRTKQSLGGTPSNKSSSKSQAGPLAPAVDEDREKDVDSSSVKQEKTPNGKESFTMPRTSPRQAEKKKLQPSDVLCDLNSSSSPSTGRNQGNGSATNRKRKSRDLQADIPHPKLKRKRVSFGGQLSPELFDKRLPPDSPLRKGAMPARRSLSIMRKPQSLLRRASTIGLIREFRVEQRSPKALRSPQKKALTPPKKSPKIKVKSPSARKPISPKQKTLTPSKPTRRSPTAKHQSLDVDESLKPKGRKSVGSQPETPTETLETPSGRKSTAISLPKSVTPKRVSSSSLLTGVTPTDSSKAVFSIATSSKPATPFSGDKSVNNATPTVLGRFSISRIETPSPVAEQNSDRTKSCASEVAYCATPNIPLRRKSFKSARKMPKSARKSVQEVMRSRRSGASRANLKVMNSWADIVKYGETKSQVINVAKKQATRRKALKKGKTLKPKTPICQIRDHFSTGHAASPATIVVGKAHAKAVLSKGCVPKLVQNVALLQSNRKISEDLTGIAEVFKTPVNVHQRSDCCVSDSSLSVDLSDISSMGTPEGSGEMMVSPLNMAETTKRNRYSDNAVIQLHVEPEGSFTDGHPIQMENDGQTEESKNVTPKQKIDPPMPLTGVRRLLRTPKLKEQHVEDLTGIKRLLKTPKGPKVSQELGLTGVKQLMMTPKVKGQLVEDMARIQRVMKTPEVKMVTSSSLTGVKHLMQTPKQSLEPVEDMIGVKRLMQTPKQKNEPVEDMIGIKRLMQTPKEKNEPVEDMVGIKRLMRTPKEKNQPVEDMVGVKRILQTPKRKEEPVDSHFGISRLMKSPRQRGVEIEDFTGLSELMEEPEEKSIQLACEQQELASTVTVPGSSSVPDAELTMTNTVVNSEESQKLTVEGGTTKTRGRINIKVITKSHQSIEPLCDVDTVSASQKLPEVKPRRGKQTARVLASSHKVKVEVSNSTAAVPYKVTRGRKQKPAEESKKPLEENLSEILVDDVNNECLEEKARIHPEAPEHLEPTVIVVASKKMGRGQKVPDVSADPPVRSSRGRRAKVDKEHVEQTNCGPASKPAHFEKEKVLTSKRGRKAACMTGQDTKVGKIETKAVENIEPQVTPLLDGKEEPGIPVIKSGRGRKAKNNVDSEQSLIVVPLKRTRRGGPHTIVESVQAPSDVKPKLAEPVTKPSKRARVLRNEPEELLIPEPLLLEMDNACGASEELVKASNPVVDCKRKASKRGAVVASENEATKAEELIAVNSKEPLTVEESPKSLKPQRGRRAKSASRTQPKPLAVNEIKNVAEQEEAYSSKRRALASKRGQEQALKESLATKRQLKRKVCFEESAVELEVPVVSKRLRGKVTTKMEASSDKSETTQATSAVEETEKKQQGVTSKPVGRGQKKVATEAKPEQKYTRSRQSNKMTLVKETDRLDNANITTAMEDNENVQQAATPRSVGRGRKKVAAKAEPQQKLTRGRQSVKSQEIKSNEASFMEGRNRSRGKTEKTVNANITESRPVRGTRRK